VFRAFTRGIDLAAPAPGRIPVELVRALAFRQWQCLRLIRALLTRRWDWRTCWRRVDFWLALAALVLPFGFVLLALQLRLVASRMRASR